MATGTTGEPSKRDVINLPMGLKMANPLTVPWARRAQTLGVLFYMSMFLFMPFVCFYYPTKWFFTEPYWWIVMCVYGLWWLYDRDAPSTGGHRQSWFVNFFAFRFVRDYFPVTLHKTVELDPTRNYIFGYHPHGIMSVGAFVNFATNATDFSTVFPGIRSTLITLVGQFWFPFRRDMIMWLNVQDSSKASISNLLRNYGKGQAVCIVVGGASEAADTHQDHIDLTLKRRKGFIKIAIRHGADLVPVFCFGENTLYYNTVAAPDSILKKIQYFIKTYAGVPPMLFSGRGVFLYSWGLMPFRHPVDTVVGTPIRVEQCDEPTSEQISALQTRYIEGLTAVFEDNKERFGLGKEVHLNIVG